MADVEAGSRAQLQADRASTPCSTLNPQIAVAAQDAIGEASARRPGRHVRPVRRGIDAIKAGEMLFAVDQQQYAAGLPAGRDALL